MLRHWSEYSIYDGNVAGGKETDFAGPRRGPHTSPTRRHATLNDLGKTATRAVKAGNMSIGNLPPREEVPLKRKASARSETDNTEPATSRLVSNILTRYLISKILVGDELPLMPLR